MPPKSSSNYRRTKDQWDELTHAGLAFLEEQARMQRTTTYTEMNSVLEQRTSAKAFDFAHDRERAAMGRLLCHIVESNRPTSGLMISAIVIYLNENDAGGGFYRLAGSYGLLPSAADADARLVFWSGEVAKVHDYYRPTPRR